MNIKIERINSNLQRELSYILANEVKNPWRTAPNNVP